MKRSEYRCGAAKKWIKSKTYFLFISLMILAMAAADLMNMINLFQQMGLGDTNAVLSMIGIDGSLSSILSDSVVFSVISVLILEILPISLGSMLAKIIDRTQHMDIDSKKNWIGFVCGIICFGAFVVLVVYMRWILFKASGAYADYQIVLNTNWSSVIEGTSEFPTEVGFDFISQIFLLPLPLLTSIWAFVASWDVTASHNLEDLKLEVEKLRRNMIAADKAYLKADNKKKDAKWALWCDLSLEQTDDPNPKNAMPSNYDTFRYECAKRIRSRHISNCILQYRDESKRYDSHAMQLLNELQKELSKLSTVPERIMAISIEELIRTHDQDTPDADCWDYERSYTDHERLLKKLLMNATVIAQYKTADSPIFTDSRSE